jgi:hypothetical protein
MPKVDWTDELGLQGVLQRPARFDDPTAGLMAVTSRLMSARAREEEEPQYSSWGDIGDGKYDPENPYGPGDVQRTALFATEVATTKPDTDVEDVEDASDADEEQEGEMFGAPKFQQRGPARGFDFGGRGGYAPEMDMSNPYDFSGEQAVGDPFGTMDFGEQGGVSGMEYGAPPMDFQGQGGVGGMEYGARPMDFQGQGGVGGMEYGARPMDFGGQGDYPQNIDTRMGPEEQRMLMLRAIKARLNSDRPTAR